MTEPVKEEVEQRQVPFRGRTLTMKRMNTAQLTLLSREARLLQKDGIEPGRKLTGASRMFEAIESMVVGDEDKEWFSDLVAAGEADLLELIELVKAFKEPEEKPKVRRGRPPRARA